MDNGLESSGLQAPRSKLALGLGFAERCWTGFELSPRPDSVLNFLRSYPGFAEDRGQRCVEKFIEALKLDAAVLGSCTLEDAHPRGAVSWLAEATRALASEEPSPRFFEEALLDALACFVVPRIDRIRDAWASKSQTLGLSDEALRELDRALRSSFEDFANRVAMRALVLEMHIAKLRGEVVGDTPEDRYEFFVDLLRSADGRRAFLEQYPVIARVLIPGVEARANAHLELVDRLCEDITAISSRMGSEQRLPVKAVEFDLGDPHCGGRAVACIEFESGQRVIYKPRSLALTHGYYALVDELVAANGDDYGLLSCRTPWILERGDYGWIEFVERSECASYVDVEMYYQRLGQHLALFLALGSLDIHAENLLAVGGYPVPIDLETAMRALIKAPEDRDHMMSGSVLEVGLLPVRQWGAEDVPGVDLSALGPGYMQPLPFMIHEWKGRGTDEYRLELAPGSLAISSSLPSVDGEFGKPVDFLTQLIVGFTAMYWCIADRTAHEGLEWLAARMAGAIRCIPRPTAYYGELFYNACHPENLQNGAVFDAYLGGSILFDTKKDSEHEHLLQRELRELAFGDIPYLEVEAPHRSFVLSDEGKTIALDESPAAYCQVRLARMSASDHAFQCQLIIDSIEAGALSEAHLSERAGVAPSKPPSKFCFPRRAATTTSTATEFGEALLRLALERPQGLTWTAITPRTPGEYVVQGVGVDLYRGGAGIALFLGYLGACLGNAAFSRAAERAYSFALYGALTAENGLTAPGVFDGLAGLLYVGDHLRHLGLDICSDDRLTIEAKVLDSIRQGTIGPDVTGGVAGIALAYGQGSLSFTTLADGFELSSMLVDDLIRQACVDADGASWTIETPEGEARLNGFAHGTSGVIAALALAAAGNPKAASLIEGGLLFEKRSFSEQWANWRDLRPRSDGVQEMYGNGWCHGAPGVLLARAMALNTGAIDRLGTDAEHALASIDSHWFEGGHSICHGGLGNAEIAIILGAMLDDRRLSELGRDHALRLAELGRRDGWVSGVQTGAMLPSLLLGLAGTGLALLNVVSPRDVPSVLLLESAPT